MTSFFMLVLYCLQAETLPNLFNSEEPRKIDCRPVQPDLDSLPPTLHPSKRNTKPMRTHHQSTPNGADQPVADMTAYRGRLALAMLFALLLMVGCTSGGPLLVSDTRAVESYGGVVESVLNYSLPVEPTPEPTPEVRPQVIMATDGARVNVRSVPSTDGEIIGKADNGQVFDVLGRSEDEQWWQVCCIAGGAEGWVSAAFAQLATDAAEVAVAGSPESLFDSTLQATWNIDWSCSSEEGRCTVPACDANVTAGVARDGDGQYLPVEYEVAWSEECFSTDSWVFEVDPSTGLERTGEYTDNFLYAYWVGANAGDISGVIPLGQSQGVVVTCSGPDTVEIEEGDGWTTSYEGVTCHDRGTGMLVYMNYVKRWLFTGEFEGKSYERAFFGDTETLEQRLVDTNANLLLVDRKQ